MVRVIGWVMDVGSGSERAGETILLLRESGPRSLRIFGRIKGYGLKCPGWWECSLAAISQTTTHMHGHHEATMGLAGVSLGRELRALALSHTASVRRGTA